MAPENPALAGVQQAATNTETAAQASDKKGETDHPFLKIFGGDIGVSEFVLPRRMARAQSGRFCWFSVDGTGMSSARYIVSYGGRTQTGPCGSG